MQKNHNQIPKIRVIVRKRPLSKKQFSRGEKDIIQIPNAQTVLVKQEKVKVDLTPYLDEYKLIFDAAFNENSTNQQIYVSMVRPLIDAAFDGAKVSCFAYGQTGSGKTYTMLGDGKNVRGLYLLASKDVFDSLKSFQDVSVWVSFYEIYCGKLFDLLNERNVLYARQDAKNNINIVGLSERKAQNINEIMNFIEYGMNSRVTAQNSTNLDSSRSHAILQISLKKNKKLHGKVSFIDLAGSERAADHADQTDKQTRIDGAEINKSLLALKECIRALDQNKHHTPFRGSKLTMVLKDSFVGYCKTVMIANVSPNSSSCENTLNTLKYADRVKELKKSANQEKLLNDHLNDLSKELMLPRQLMNHHQVSRNEQQKSFEAQKSLMRNNFINQNNDMNNANNYRQKDNAKNADKAVNVQQVYQKSPARKYRAQSEMIHSPNHPKHEQTEQEIYQRLNQRHEEMLQKVLEGEEKLITQHTQYIDFSVETTKKHIELMKDSDQQGSSIENYLNQLDSNLEKELEAIYKIKALIDNLKYNLDESKKIEQLYVQLNEKIQNISQFKDNQSFMRQQNTSIVQGSSLSMMRQQNSSSIYQANQFGNYQQSTQPHYQSTQPHYQSNYMQQRQYNQGGHQVNNYQSQNYSSNYVKNKNQGNYQDQYQNERVGNYRSEGVGELNFNYSQYSGDMEDQREPDLEIEEGQMLLFDD